MWIIAVAVGPNPINRTNEKPIDICFVEWKNAYGHIGPWIWHLLREYDHDKDKMIDSYKTSSQQLKYQGSLLEIGVFGTHIKMSNKKKDLRMPETQK